MPRQLSEKDVLILKKLAPECKDLDCTGSGTSYKSILPPLTNHFVTNEADFVKRLSYLEDTELEYLLTLIENGTESLGCVPQNYLQAFMNIVTERVGEEKAKKVFLTYIKKPICDLK